MSNAEGSLHIDGVRLGLRLITSLSVLRLTTVPCSLIRLLGLLRVVSPLSLWWTYIYNMSTCEDFKSILSYAHLEGGSTVAAAVHRRNSLCYSSRLLGQKDKPKAVREGLLLVLVRGSHASTAACHCQC